MDFNDKTKFKKLTTFSGFSRSGTSPENLVYYEASEGYYVSSEGEVWSTKNKEPKKLGSLGGGYCECTVKLKDNKFKSTSIHRLVATCWCEGFNLEEGKIIVNHIDENKQNNHPSNLEWCTNKYNVNHGTGIERTKQAQKGIQVSPERKAKMSRSAKERWNNPESRYKILQSRKGTWENPEYREKVAKSVREQWKNLEYREKLSKSHRGQHKSTEQREKISKSSKHLWKNPEHREKMAQALWKNPSHIAKISQANSKPVALFHSDGTVYQIFSSCTDASRYAGVNTDTITKWLKLRKPSKCGNYYWGYMTEKYPTS